MLANPFLRMEAVFAVLAVTAVNTSFGVGGLSPKIKPSTAQTNLTSKTPVPPDATSASDQIYDDYWAENERMKNANNAAVRLILRGRLVSASEILRSLVEQRHDYTIARTNLAVCYNNMALSELLDVNERLDLIFRARCIDWNNDISKTNAQYLIWSLKKSPDKFADHLALADAQQAQNCLYGAYCQYREALQIQPDIKTTRKLKRVIAIAAASRDDDPNGAFFVKLAEPSKARIR